MTVPLDSSRKDPRDVPAAEQSGELTILVLVELVHRDGREDG